MAEIKKGSFTLDFGVFKMDADVSEDDRQCAWEVYTEIVTRVAVSGKAHDAAATDFSGEVLAESLASLHAFFGELRSIMRHFPVGRLSRDKKHHLGVLINDAIANTLRPFLERWQAEYQHWWKDETNESQSPQEQQKAYSRYDEFLQDWTNLRQIMRLLARELAVHYKLVDVSAIPRLLTFEG